MSKLAFTLDIIGQYTYFKEMILKKLYEEGSPRLDLLRKKLEDSNSLADFLECSGMNTDSVFHDQHKGSYAEFLYYICFFLFKDRWPEAEEFIIKSPEYATFYALNIIGDRWLAAEDTIASCPKSTKLYVTEFSIKKGFKIV